jgi:hypothetical protein
MKNNPEKYIFKNLSRCAKPVAKFYGYTMKETKKDR